MDEETNMHHDFDTVSQEDDYIMETQKSVSDDEVRTFCRTDGALVKCLINDDVLELVIVEFSDGERVEIEPMFVDEQMIYDGLGENTPTIN